MNDDEIHVKVHVTFPDGDPRPARGEFLWAAMIPGRPYHYKVDNIPFMAYNISYGDIVHALPSYEFEREVTGVIEPSGCTVIRLAFDPEDEATVMKLADDILRLGARREKATPWLMSIAIDPGVDMGHVAAMLDSAQDNGVLQWEMGTLDEVQW